MIHYKIPSYIYCKCLVTVCKDIILLSASCQLLSVPHSLTNHFWLDRQIAAQKIPCPGLCTSGQLVGPVVKDQAVHGKGQAAVGYLHIRVGLYAVCLLRTQSKLNRNFQLGPILKIMKFALNYLYDCASIESWIWFYFTYAISTMHIILGL